jgi:sRNA-binding regulator protein Hfq
MIAAVDNTTVIADVSDRDVLVHKHATGREPLEINHEPLEATKTPQ